MTWHTRRQFLRFGGVTGLGGLLATMGGCIGDQDGGPTADDHPVLETVEYFGVNNIGSRMGGDEPLHRFNYRSEVPFQMETDVGGVLASRNHKEGIRLEIDLTEDDDYGDAHIQSSIRRLEDISRIQYRADEDLFVGLQLGIEYNDESIFKWEEVTDTRERGVGLDGDEPRLAGRLEGPSVTIERDDPVFSQPQSETTRSITDLTDIHGNVPSRVVAALDGGSVPWTPDDSDRTTVITEFKI